LLVDCGGDGITVRWNDPRSSTRHVWPRARAARIIPGPESTAAPTNLLQQSFGSYDDYEVTSGPVVEAEIVTSDLLWFNG
jgi:hypothetical protein